MRNDNAGGPFKNLSRILSLSWFESRRKMIQIQQLPQIIDSTRIHLLFDYVSKENGPALSAALCPPSHTFSLSKHHVTPVVNPISSKTSHRRHRMIAPFIPCRMVFVSEVVVCYMKPMASGMWTKFLSVGC